MFSFSFSSPAQGMGRRGFHILVLLGLLISLLTPQQTARAATTLSVTPITWNVIGLDSNNVNVGPNHFPIGVRVKNTGASAATNVTASFVWDSSNSYINIRPGTNSTLSVPSLAPGASTDFYFEVEVTRNSSAYDTTRRYHIEVTADSGATTGSTPTPRELYVEHLISQSRNAVTDMQLSADNVTYTSIPNGGTMNLMVGNTYYIKLVGSTATNGYEQIESFINFPNTIFQVLSATTTYTAESSATLNPPYDTLYGDACVWENDPNNPNYRSCLSTGKAGGNITVTYKVKILQIPSSLLVNPEPLSTLIYDFSGSSYHYNSDFSVSTRYANIINAGIVKAFSPKTINPGGTSTLKFTITNPGPDQLTGVNFVDALPSGVSVASTPTLTYSGCGSPTPASLSGGETSLSFSNITVNDLSTCTISVNVTASADGVYDNTSSDLLINTSIDTGSFATDSLVVSSLPAPPSSCTTRTPMAAWTLSNYTASTSTQNGPFNASSQHAYVSTATGTYGSQTGSSSGIVNTTTFPAGWSAPSTSGNNGNSWGIRGAWLSSNPATPATATTPYFQFQVDASRFGGVQIAANYNLQGNWSNSGNWYVLTSTDGATWSALNTAAWSKANAWQTGIIGTTTSTASTIYFRVFAAGAQYSGNPSATNGIMYLDDIVVSGCLLPDAPTLSKAFSPVTIPQGSASTLTFTLTNPNSSALTGVSFTDTLPTGLTINTPNGLTASCTTGTLTGGTTTAASGTTLISLSGATLSANANCTISVSVKGNAAGDYTNISGNISSTETGVNTTSNGYGASSLTVVAPPVIAKSFTANPIFTGNTTTLTFNITNPNTTVSLTGVNFTDNLPPGLVVDSLTSNTCGGTATATNGSSTISLSGVTLAAGASCTVSVSVQGTSAGLKENSVTVNSTNGGTGNTSTASVVVKAPAPAINLLKQVGPTASGPWTSFLGITSLPANVYYKFTVENIGDVALASVNVTDSTVPVINTALGSCSWTDGDGTSLTAPFSLPVADVSDNQLATCIIGPFTASSGSHPNTATASGAYNSTTVTDTSTATYGTAELTLDKTVTETYFISAGTILHYSYLVTNSGGAPLPGPVTVSDDKATVTCPDVSTVGDNDNYFDPGESLTCTASYSVTAGDVTAGSVTNTASAAASGITSNTDSETVYKAADFTADKTNNVSGTAAQNGTFNWTITVTNISSGAGQFKNTQTILSDSLPGAAGYYTAGPLTVMPGGTAPTGGTIDCSITGTTLSCVANGDVTFPANASFSVTFAVTPTAAGSLINTATVDPNGSITELDETNNSDQDTVTVIAPPSISKSFAPDPILVGETSTLTFTITNPNSGTALTGVGFTDSLPSGLEVAPTPNKSVSAGCGSPTFTPAAGGTTLTFTGGTIPASGTCTVTVDITATTNGVMSNTTGNVTSTNGGTGNTGSDTLTVNPKADLAVTKDDGVTSVSAGGTTIYTIRVTNNGPSSVTGAVLSDPFVTGLSKTAVACSPTPGQCVTPPTVSQLEGGTFALPALASGEFYEITVTANVTATSGSVTNTAAVAPPSGTTDSDNTNDSDNDTDTVSSAPAIALTKTATLDDTVVAPSGVVNAGDRITYTFSVKNTGNVIITNIVVTDPLLPTLSCTIASLAPGATASCTASNNIYILTQADIDAGSRANTATATGKDPGNNDVTDTDSKTVTLTQNPSLNVVKSSTTTSITAAGQVAPYTFTVTNTGNVTLTNVTVTDAKCDASPTLQSGDTDNDSKLDLTETWVFTCSHTVTQAEVDAGGNLSNTVTADSTESGPDTDTLNIPITQTASMTVEKSSATTSLSAPGKVTYNYQVTNTGNVTLTGISLSDDNDNDDMNCPAATLAPSATMTCSATHTFTQAELDAGGTLDNTVTASSNEAPDATDNLSIPINQNPELTIVKSSDATGTNAVGDTITYTYDVENTGNVTLTNVTVTDAHAGLSAITCTPAQGSTLAPGDTMQCTATYVLTQDDIDAGKVDNTGVVTGTPPSGLKVTDDDLLSEPIAQAPGIDVQKTLVSVTFDSPQLIRMTYSIVVTNTGDTTLTQIQVTDDLASAFAPASSFSIVSVLSSVFTVNPAFNGSSNTNLLTGTDALAPGDSGTITLVVLVDSGGDADNYTNTAVSSGKPPSGPDVTDTDSTSGPSFVDPVVTKAVNPSQAAVGDPVTFTITVTNNGTLPAANVFVTDTLPDALDLASVNPVEINPPAAGTFTITPPRTVTIDLGTLDVDEVIVITIRAIVNNLDNPPIQNTAQVTTDSPFSLTALWDGDLTSNNTSTASINAPSGGGGGGGGGTGGGGLHIPITGGLLPSTGFAPGVITSVPPQPLEKAYFATDDIWLEIPRLGVSTSIVGVPRSADGNWDVTWLLQEAGWLQGTAFPTWKGNSVLTGHVYLPSGKPGPFVDLAKLRWDDKIIVRAFGQEYVYRVRENLVVSPTDTSVIKHEDDAWLTLITCKGYDEKSNTYAHRVVIRAVLVSVEDARKSTPNGGR